MKGQFHVHGGKREKRLPVFVAPEELQFVGEDEASHKQTLTVFNPYDFNIRFQVLSNAPHKYSVVESRGTIRPHCCVDLVVRHRLAADGPYNVSDKFRVEVYFDTRDNRPVGRKQVISTLLKTKSQGLDEPERLSDFRSVPSPMPYVQFPQASKQAGQAGPGVLLILSALVCLLVLLFPLEGEGPDWPSYLHITVNQKLIAAFALGLVTMAILKS